MTLFVALAACRAPAAPCAPCADRTADRAAADPDPSVVVEKTVWITPEIRADVRVLSDDVQSVEVTFASGAQPMLVLALSQGANTAISGRGAAVGTASIEPGLRIDLQIATPLQPGAVYLDGDFASANVPTFHYQGVLVTWTAPKE